MFGSEGERLQELRQQQARQYAEQLRQQIAAKNSQKPKTPALYSTTTSDSYANPIQQSRTQRINLSSSNTPSTISQSSSTNSTDRLQKIVIEPLPNLQSTNVAPLNLTITSFQPDPAPSLPRQQTYSLSSITDTSSFNERIRSLESSIEQDKLLLTQTKEASSKIFQSKYPAIEISINDIQTSINHFLNSELSQKVNPISSLLRSNRETLESENMKIKSDIEELRDLSADINSSTQQFNTKFNDTIESIKQSNNEVKIDNNRLLDQIDLSFAKISLIENRETVVTDGASHNANDFEKIDNDVSSSFTNLQKSTNESMNTITSQIAREIKVESDSREHLTISLSSQVSEVNKNVSENVTRIQSLINQLALNFKESIQLLNDSFGESLNTIQDELIPIINKLNDQINSLITSSEENFSIFQKETVSTMETLKNIVTQTRNVIEQAISIETNIQTKNKNEINSKFESFDLLIQNEMEVQIQRMNEIGENSIRNGKSVFDNAMQDGKTDLIVINQHLEKLDSVESKLNEIEKSFSKASDQVNQSLHTLTENYNDLSQKFQQTENSIEDTFQEVEKALEDLTFTKLFSYVKREELIGYESRVNDIYEKRINEIESQISMALSYLAEISVRKTSGSGKKRPGSGTQKIKMLVNNDKIDSDEILSQSNQDDNDTERNDSDEECKKNDSDVSSNDGNENKDDEIKFEFDKDDKNEFMIDGDNKDNDNESNNGNESNNDNESNKSDNESIRNDNENYGENGSDDIKNGLSNNDDEIKFD